MLCTFAADSSSLISALRACCSDVPLFLRAIISTSKVVLFPLYTTLEVYTRYGMDSKQRKIVVYVWLFLENVMFGGVFLHPLFNSLF